MSEPTKVQVNQLLLNKIKAQLEGPALRADELECLSRALERVGLRS
jgi:hypothetical protein